MYKHMCYFLLVCNLIITQVNGEDYLYFSKPLATNVTIDITYSGQFCNAHMVQLGLN